MAIIITLAQILEGTQFTAVNIYSRFISGIERLLINGGVLWYMFFQFPYTLCHETLIWVETVTLCACYHILYLSVRRSVVVRVVACQEEESRAGMGAEPLLFFSLHHVPWICRSGI